jgi:hypothetical protein
VGAHAPRGFSNLSTREPQDRPGSRHGIAVVSAMLIRSFIAWTQSPSGSDEHIRIDGDRGEWRHWRDGPLQISFAPRLPSPLSPTSPELSTLILGDDCEFDPAAPDQSLASGVPVQLDRRTKRLSIITSLVALPPVFLYRGQRGIAVTSDLHLLRGLPGVRLQFDARAIGELGHFGHPVGHRTLFSGVSLVPAGSRLLLGPGLGAVVERVWQLPERARLGWPEFVEAQIAAFTTQVSAMDVSRSFLALTAGLDTRTVFAVLASQKRLAVTATMTGPRPSLDARIAARLSRAYGIPHEPVVFDDAFVRELPRYMRRASLLSGGLATLSQASEVHLYECLGGYAGRLSGNLGNQVGRGGTEGVSVRGAELRVLAPELRAAAPPAAHWLLDHLDREERERLTFILQNEIPFTLVGNFSVGNHFAAQQTPYASRALIESLATRPARGPARTDSKLRLRLRDLRHRFLGEPEAHSFQRTLVNRIGGFAAHCPVNWGWRPDGGVSVRGTLMGAATLVGMAARAKGLDAGALSRPLAWTGLPALHDFREGRRWLHEDLHEFTLDTLGSHAIRDANLFDWSILAPLLHSYFRGNHEHFETVLFALDVGMAQEIFCS